MMNFPDSPYPDLPPNTIVPSPVDKEDIFIQYFNRLYEDIAFAINQRDFNYYTMQVTSVAQNIPFIPTFGSFLILVSGVDSSLPTAIWSACKADASLITGSITLINTQDGTRDWSGFAIIVTSTLTHFQIAHSRTGVTANFNIRVVGTQ